MKLGYGLDKPWETDQPYHVDPKSIKKITFESKVYAPRNSTQLFSTLDGKGLINLSSIEGMQFLDTSHVTNMTRMFDQMKSIQTLDLSSFNTQNVNSMNAMFANTRSLVNLNLNNFITSSVTDMSGMFYDTPQINNFALSSFDTSRVTDMSNMFYNDTDINSLTNLSLSTFDFSQVKNKSDMLYGQKKLDTISLPTSFYDPNNTVSLPEITENEQFSGNWKNENGETVGPTNEFLKNYRSTSAGTFTWEEKVDPLNPDDPTQTDLLLREVPNGFTFQTKLTGIDYQLSADPSDEKFIIYNNREDRSWSVKAEINHDELIGNSQDTFEVQQFRINGINLIGTGASGVICKSTDNKTIGNNVGNIQTEVKSAAIDFSDVDFKLKANEVLQGQINYHLYNTPTAE
ncbi:BspA family leucine-rich repeat surface protein [Enterococcus gilvus]|uniref:BspA family leucine-rich repeat surface protein n=1 Tax=Enterococcus gilvus TaxID=160453 RepID=UPI003EDACC3D